MPLNTCHMAALFRSSFSTGNFHILSSIVSGMETLPPSPISLCLPGPPTMSLQLVSILIIFLVKVGTTRTSSNSIPLVVDLPLRIGKASPPSVPTSCTQGLISTKSDWLGTKEPDMRNEFRKKKIQPISSLPSVTALE